VTFAGTAGTDRVVGAMEAFKGLLVERPGSTRVVLHVPAPSGGPWAENPQPRVGSVA
jgi:hypothetical protein